MWKSAHGLLVLDVRTPECGCRHLSNPTTMHFLLEAYFWPSTTYMLADNFGTLPPMGSAFSTPDLTTSINDKEPTKSKVDADGKLTVAQDVAGIVLSTLQQAAELAPVPYLKEAAGLAVALFEMVQVKFVVSATLLLCYTVTHFPIQRPHQKTNQHSRRWPMTPASSFIRRRVFGRIAKRITTGSRFLKI